MIFMRPKSLLAVVLCISMLFAISMAGQIFAADCVHTYEETILPATCIEKEQIQYTCSQCGDTYTVYADDPVLPDSCYILLKSTKSEGQLTVTVSLENNPGIYFMKMIFQYNSTALAYSSCTNGTVWTDGEHWDPTVTEHSVSYIAENAEPDNNAESGLLCTLVFDILDDSADYGFTVKLDKRPFINWDNDLIDVEILNIVGKSELGDHSYEEYVVPPTCMEDGYKAMVCIYCKETLSEAVLPATGHQWVLEKEITSPTFEREGLGLYTCSNCGETKEEVLPILEHWKKGDLNNDGVLNMEDVVQMRLTVASPLSIPLQVYDAADLDNDSVVSMTDYAYIIRIAAGNMPMPPGWE